MEHLKRYTTLGMATDQGKTSNVTAIALMAEHTEKTIAASGVTTFRPPYTPVTMGALAGHHRGGDFRPTRLTPSHAWARQQGAVFIETGPWLRAQWFPRAGESGWLEPVCREVRAVRSSVGVCDVSTLGKIDVQGPDAARFLDRLYANGYASLAVGRTRYGIMLREDGFVMDDGTVARLAETRYLITTTTANAVRVYQHMHFCHQVLWPELDVQFVSVTDQWAQFAVAGPRSRELLERVLDSRCDISNAAFPYMANGAVTLANGQRGRLFRISFSGEMAYEIAVPARSGEALIRQLFEAGADMGVTAYGLESLNVMRIEKGHMTGNELNGQTTAYDLGLGRMCSTQKDYVGAMMARRASLLEPARPRLVGIRALDPKARVCRWHAFRAEGGRAHGRKRPGPRVVGLLLADPEPVDRTRSAQAWPGATRRAGGRRRSSTRRTDRGRDLCARLRRPRGSAPSCLTRCALSSRQAASAGLTARPACRSTNAWISHWRA